MIKNFKHKGLENFFYSGSQKGIIANHSKKVTRILDRLDCATNAQDMNLPGYRLHKLIGKEKGYWAVEVNANWRITFSFENEDAIWVDYIDYH